MGFGCMSNSYLEIAQPEPWTGEGLPPVGTLCEFAGFNPEETIPTDPRVGDQVTVIAHFMSGSFEVAAFTFMRLLSSNICRSLKAHMDAFDLSERPSRSRWKNARKRSRR